MKDNKTLHAIWLALVAIGAILSSGGTYLVKDTNIVMDRTETERVIENKLMILKNEQLINERDVLIKEVTRDMRITSTERLSIQNQSRIREVEEQYIEQKVITQQILEEVKK